MNPPWQDLQTKSVLTLHKGIRRYHAVVEPEPDECYGGPGFKWGVYKFFRENDCGWNPDMYTAKLEAEQALEKLMMEDAK